MAQQAAEKALKATIRKDGMVPPWTHDLVALRAIAPAPVRAETKDLELEALSGAAIDARYPDPSDSPYTESEVQRFVATASTVLDATRTYLGRTGMSVESLEPA